MVKKTNCFTNSFLPVELLSAIQVLSWSARLYVDKEVSSEFDLSKKY